MLDAVITNIDSTSASVDYSNYKMARDRPYYGQPHTTTGARGMLEVKGLTMRDLFDCYVRAVALSHAYTDDCGNPIEPNQSLIKQAVKGVEANLTPNNLYMLVGGTDPVAVFQNFACEVEKMMNVFPHLATQPKER